MDPHQWTLHKLNLKSYHLHNGMQLCKKSVNRSWLKGIKHFLHSLGSKLAKTQIKMMFKAQSESAQKLIEDVVEKFELTSDQERAFRIVANHAVSPGAEQLMMYVGGMGGTGKSQVIKALMEFYKSRNESHRFVVLAPTGTAAALLHGSTYHSFLGVPIDSQTAFRNETTNNEQVKTRLDGVEYIFLDEVSMVACDDNYKISSQLAKGLNEFGMPYGGINMIFAGDFAQLPPVFGSPLYSGSVAAPSVDF